MIRYGPVPLSVLATPAGKAKMLRALVPGLSPSLTDEQIVAIASVPCTPESEWMRRCKSPVMAPVVSENAGEYPVTPASKAP